MTWIYNGIELNEIPPKAVGFVYLMTNSIDGKKYYGKKVFHFSKTIQKNKKKKKVKVESDWKIYNSSSEEINALVEQGIIFHKEILRICYSKSELSYYEAKYQIENDVLLHPDLYYNKWISVKITSMHCKNFA